MLLLLVSDTAKKYLVHMSLDENIYVNMYVHYKWEMPVTHVIYCIILYTYQCLGTYCTHTNTYMYIGGRTRKREEVV